VEAEPLETELDAGPLGRVRSAYLDHLSVERALADNTLLAYRRDLGRYISYLDDQGVTDLAGATPGHVGAFLGYLISHESHHRGQIALILKQAGMPLDRKVAYGVWEWGVR
jgi:integrase/recombinase XerD